MTKHEAVVISAFTGISMCEFSAIHEYIGKVLGRPVWTHELVYDEVWTEIKEASEEDFLAICANLTD